MKHSGRECGSAPGEDFLSRLFCSAYVDLVREDLMNLPSDDEELVIPLSGSDGITVAEYDARFGSRRSR